MQRSPNYAEIAHGRMPNNDLSRTFVFSLSVEEIRQADRWKLTLVFACHSQSSRFDTFFKGENENDSTPNADGSEGTLYSIVSLLDAGSASAVTWRFCTPFPPFSCSILVSSWKCVAKRQRAPGVADEEQDKRVTSKQALFLENQGVLTAQM